MKKTICIILLIVVGIGIGFVIPKSLTGKAEAKGNNSEIVGSWVSTYNNNATSPYASTMIQFFEDGTGVYYQFKYSYVFTYFTYSYDSKNSKIVISSKYTPVKGQDEIILKDKECTISICENGMIFFNPFVAASDANQSYSFIRA